MVDVVHEEWPLNFYAVDGLLLNSKYDVDAEFSSNYDILTIPMSNFDIDEVNALVL